MDYEHIIESILFASGDPYPVHRLAEILEIDEEQVLRYADSLESGYRYDNRGIRLVKLEGALQLCSAQENAGWVKRALDTRKAARLSPAALEVLAIAAYFQPITKSRIEQIRGIDSGYTVGLLVEKGFLEPCGKLDAPGKPMQYRTTAAFLRTFGLSALSELPTGNGEESTDGRTEEQTEDK